MNKNLYALLAVSVLSACSGRNIHKELKEDQEVLTRNWTLPTKNSYTAGDRGTEFSNSVLVENTLIFGSRNQGVVSIYPVINQVRWVLPVARGVQSEMAVGPNATLYFTGGDGFLYSVNSDNGRVNWRYEVRNPITSKPVIANGRLFLTTADDAVFALDAGTGKWLWHYRRRSASTATILGASAPLVNGNDLLVGLSDGYLVSLTIAEGKLKWEKKLHTGNRFTDVDASAVIADHVIYIPSYDGSLYALRDRDASVIWKFDTAGGSKRVTLDGDRIYFPASDGYIYCLNKNNAKVLWKFELDKGTPTQLVIADQQIIVGSSHQYLYVLNKEDGKATYRYNVGHGSGFAGSPTYDPQKRRVYFLSHAGNLYSFTLRKPKKLFAHGQTSPFKF
jgi:outer membrane protein assembly factor BamB